ncbi:hypothetical protein [Novosphingobium sp. Gsoil 351]|uniref:hypothetical protein n=1 Tax=Novosphingobium sp. Gsoil 351 TaxID=2675225 RepID=UPI0012B46DE6|nr:hypothetical protein [Novosphingobium sp. Gsoil 351]QGN54209.1 hypothetical protein GKE62_06260 [Novosphingobium sp. Gsoil 351]
MNGGYLLRDGAYGSLNKAISRMRCFRSPETAWSAHMQVEMADLVGRKTTAEGMAMSQMSEAGYGTNQFMRWDFDGRVGWGEDQDVWDALHFVRMLDALKTLK